VLLLVKNSPNLREVTSSHGLREACPACGSKRYKKNGHTRHGKQNHQCKACERQFTGNAIDRSIASEQRRRIAPLLRERISLRGICRTVGVSLTWLLHFMVECFTACPDDLHVECPARPTAVVLSRLEAEADEMWSFVQKKATKSWIWSAMDATTRQIMAFHVGDRSRASGKELWAKMPMVYREQALFHTDQYGPPGANGYGQEADCPASCRCKTARDRFRSCSFST